MFTLPGVPVASALPPFMFTLPPAAVPVPLPPFNVMSPPATVVPLPFGPLIVFPTGASDTSPFVSKVSEYCTSNPEFSPSFFNADEFQKDFNAAAMLKPIVALCEQICGNVDDTAMLAGSEAYQAALLYYSSVQIGAKTGQASAKPIVEDLSNRFPGRKKKKTDVPLVPVG